ncbi:peptidylprolyl isomerase [Alteromonas facilis]|uniref:peptidylprolyl isomerase n=1 Tax=Alteromonas facilis TaxID=2048004 RepID=UPI001F0CAA82|nr:peptidylprolyl isomerase [Alteromonas facilis]
MEFITRIMLMLSLVFVARVAFATEPKEELPERLDQQQLVYLYTQEGTVIIELSDSIAPKHVERFKQLVKEGFYDGLSFYRVIDGFVAQAGDPSEAKESQYRSPLKAEFSRTNKDFENDFTLIQSPEFLAEETGFINNFPAGRSVKDDRQWLLHCPGAVAMARSTEADSATTEFYIVIGQAPRHLDRNMSVFGQVVYGLEVVQKFMRGNPQQAGGVIENEEKRSLIVKALMGTDVSVQEQIALERLGADSSAFQKRIESARTLDNPFYHYAGSGNVDVCYYRPRVTVTATVSSDE